MAPRDEFERRLCEAWSAVLGLERIDIRDNFFDLGGNALLAEKLTLALRKELGIDLDISTLRDRPTVEELARVLEERALTLLSRKNDLPSNDTTAAEHPSMTALSATEIERIASSIPGGATNLQDVYPLTPLQEGILFHHQMASGRDPYLAAMLYCFDSRSRLDEYLPALQAVMERHDIFRT